MRYLSKLVVFTVVLTLLFGLSALGANKQTDVPLALEVAIEFALDSSIEYQIAILNWENTEIDRKIQALQPVQTEEDRLRMELANRQAERSLNNVLSNVVFSVTQDYFNLSKLERQVQLAKNQLALAEHDFNLVQRRVAMGELPERDLAREENRFASVRASVVSAERGYQTGIDNFFFLLGMTTEWDSVTLITEVPMIDFDLSLAESKTLASEKNYDVWEQAVNGKLAKIALQKVMAQDPAPLVLQKAENNYKINQLNGIRAERSFDQKLVNDWYSLQDAQRAVDAAEVDLALAKQDYNLKTTQFDAGLLNKNQLIQSENGYLNAISTLNDRKVSYLTAVWRYRADLGFPVWPFADGE